MGECDRPDWLPAGWKIKIGVRKSGKRDKYYIDPSNKLKFNSKPEVLRFLKNTGTGHAKSKQLKNVDTSKHSAVNIDIKKAAAENLPPGWIKEIKVKRNGGRTRSDPTYIDPVSGRHFRSMQEVFRYLEARDSGKVENKLKDKGPSEESGDHSLSLKSSSAAKHRRLADNKADKHVTGCRSVKSGLGDTTVDNDEMLEANYLKPRETKDDSIAGDLLEKQLVNETEKQENRKTQKKRSTGDEVNKNVKGEQILKSGLKGASVKNVNLPDSEKDDSVAGDFRDKLSLLDKLEKHEDILSQNMNLADNRVDQIEVGDPSLNSGSGSAEINNASKPETDNLDEREKQNSSVTADVPDMQLQVNSTVQHENVTNLKKRKRLDSKTLGDLPRRTSKRLAKMEVDPSFEVKTRSRARAATSISCEAEVYATNKHTNCESSDGLAKLKTENSDDSKQKNSATLPPRDLSPPNMPAGNDCKGTVKNEMPIDNLFNDLLKDPCIEFAIKTLTGVIPIEDLGKVNDSSVSSLASSSVISGSFPNFPLGDVWADPCFEFAVKTLTGDIPVMDTSHNRYSSQPPLNLP